jgi:hypothetical protein
MMGLPDRLGAESGFSVLWKHYNPEKEGEEATKKFSVDFPYGNLHGS